MDNLASIVSLLPSRLLLFLLSPLDSTSPSSSTTFSAEKNNNNAYCVLLQLLRFCFLLAVHGFLVLLHLFHSFAPSLLHHFPSSSAPYRGGRVPDRLNAPPEEEEGGGVTCVERALSHVLAVVTRVPVSSRKYELVRDLADRLLDENLRCATAGGDMESVNRAALSAAFSRTLRRLEAAAAMRRPGRKPDGSVERILGGVKSTLRWWAEDDAEEIDGGDGAAAAEKLAAEVMWLAENMAACGAAFEAVRRWAAATALARLAISAEPKLQGCFVRISAFLFKHASSKVMDGFQQGGGAVGVMSDGSCHPSAAACLRMDMLMSWLPLLCRASSGTDAPVLSGPERSEMVGVLEGMIDGLGWAQQEEVLSLWLHHFSSCPHSDWPNLQACYARWYSASRNLLLLHQLHK